MPGAMAAPVIRPPRMAARRRGALRTPRISRCRLAPAGRSLLLAVVAAVAAAAGACAGAARAARRRCCCCRQSPVLPVPLAGIAGAAAVAGAWYCCCYAAAGTAGAGIAAAACRCRSSRRCCCRCSRAAAGAAGAGAAAGSAGRRLIGGVHNDAIETVRTHLHQDPGPVGRGRPDQKGLRQNRDVLKPARFQRLLIWPCVADDTVRGSGPFGHLSGPLRRPFA